MVIERTGGRKILAWTRKNYSVILFCILSLSLLTKVIRLNIPKDFYFDEAYYGFTASSILHHDKGAYDPFARPPERRAYAWTHPPLAELIISFFMKIFGDRSFGWRVGSVFFGTIDLALTSILAMELFGSELVAVLAAFLLCVDGLMFTESRIAMIEVYLIFFMLLTFIYYVRFRKEPTRKSLLLLTGFFLGLSFATKWTAFFILGTIALDLLLISIRRKELPQGQPVYLYPIALVLLPAAIYLLSYFHYFWMGFHWSQFVELQRQMWYYHSHLKATHAYQSVPWQWILDLRPVWYYVNYSNSGNIANIYALGNPLVFWGGLLTMAYLIFEKGWAWQRWFLILCYCMLWVPLEFSPRIMLFYSYTAAVPFLCIALGLALQKLITEDTHAKDALVCVFLSLSVVWFIVFYPHLTALPVPKDFAESVYYLLPSWR